MSGAMLYDYYLNWGKAAERAYREGLNASLPSPYYTCHKFVFCGMGGSGIAGMYVRHLLERTGYQGSVAAVNGYHMPGWVDRRTLVFAVSFSGRTAETVKCVNNALGKGARVLLLSRGGLFEDLSRTRGLYFLRVPEAPAPRAGFAGLLYSLVGLLANMNIIDPVSWDVETSIEVLQNEVERAAEAAEHLASILYKKRGQTVIIASGDSLSPVVVRAKNELAENAKRAVLTGVFPESGHNDIEAWAGIEGKVLVLLRTGDPVEDRMLEAAAEVTEPDEVVDMSVWGSKPLTKMVWHTWVVGIASVQLGHMLGVDPESIPVISKYKKLVSPLLR